MLLERKVERVRMEANLRLQQDILWLQIAVNEPCFLQHRQRVQELTHEDLDQLGAQTLELILLDQLVKVRRQKLKDQAQMASMDERVAETENVVFVVRIARFVELELR